MLKTTQLIEKYTSADLTGRERRSYMQSKIETATKGKGVKSSNIVHPQLIRDGIERKRVQGVATKLEEAKTLGVYSNTTKHLYKDIVKEEKLSKGRKKSGKSDRGLSGSIGKYKDGTLYIGKKDIEEASRGVKGNFGIVKRSFEHVNIKKSKGNKKSRR